MFGYLAAFVAALTSRESFDSPYIRAEMYRNQAYSNLCSMCITLVSAKVFPDLVRSMEERS